MKSTLLLLLVSAVALGQTIEDRVKKFDTPRDYEIKYDKFAKSTTVQFQSLITPADLKGGGSMTIFASVTIKQTGKYWYLVFFHPTGRYKFLYNKNPLRFLLDGKLLDIPTDEITDMPGVFITSSQWNKIVAAKTVEMQFGLFEGKFDNKTLQRFKNLASLTAPSR